MNTQQQKITADDALYVIQKSARDDALEVAQKEGRAGFEYASIEEVRPIAQQSVELFKSTLDELKNR